MATNQNDHPPAKQAQKPRHGRIVGQRIDAGTYGESITPGATLFVTEDGATLPIDEVLQTRGDLQKKKGKGPAAATTALFAAALHYEKFGPIGVPQDGEVRSTLRAITKWAADNNLPDWQLLDEDNSALRTLLSAGMAALRIPPKS